MTESAVSETADAGRGEKHIVEFDPRDGDSVTTQLAVAIADATDRNVTELPPIGEWVDCDAIEQLFASHRSETEVSVSFEFEESQVFLSSIGRIVVTPGSQELGA